jgi:hypothetical protein
LKDDALAEMQAGGVDAAVLTPHTPWDPNANELCIEAARQHPEKFVILGSFPLDKPESRGLVDSWKQRPGMLGLRFTFNEPAQRTWLTDGTVDWLWPAAERAGLPTALMAARFLPKVARWRSGIEPQADPRSSRPAQRDHAPPERWANLPEVLALANIPTSPEGHGRAGWPISHSFRDIHDNLHRLTTLGPERWFWAPTSRVCPAHGVGDAVHRRAAVASRA